MVSVTLLERILGKFEFSFGIQPCLRSIFDHVYRWRDALLTQGKKTGVLTGAAREELLVAAFLLVHARVCLDAPWCGRVECFDAAPGGHGRAYCQVPPSEAAEMGKYSEAKTAHPFLRDVGVNLDAEKRCPLYRVTIPEGVHWHEIGRSGGYKHITLEEAECCLWSVENRLKRPLEVGSRVIHAGDNAPQIASFIKGRSSSRKLNGRCRRACSLTLGGGLLIFYVWVSTKRNPADRPSRLHLQDPAPHFLVSQPLPRDDIVLRIGPAYRSETVWVFGCVPRELAVWKEAFLRGCNGSLNVEVVELTSKHLSLYLDRARQGICRGACFLGFWT